MRAKQNGKLLFNVLGVFAALVFLGYGLKERSEITSIQKRGKLATVEPPANYNEFKKGGSSTYTAEFRFRTEDGREIVKKQSFPEEVLSDFKAGKSVQVFYLPNDPSTFVFANEKPGWALVIGGVVFLVAVLLLA
jgi:hypothetical protein